MFYFYVLVAGFFHSKLCYSLPHHISTSNTVVRSKKYLQVRTCLLLLGSTPAKTEYEHVKEVTKPLVHENLLTVFRAERIANNEEVAANLALPLSDSDEEEEDNEEKDADGANGIEVRMLLC